MVSSTDRLRNILRYCLAVFSAAGVAAVGVAAAVGTVVIVVVVPDPGLNWPGGSGAARVAAGLRVVREDGCSAALGGGKSRSCPAALPLVSSRVRSVVRVFVLA